MWDILTGEIAQTLQGHGRGAAGVAYDLDGTRLACAGSDGTCRVWDTATGAVVQTLSRGMGAMTGVAFTPDGSRLATLSAGVVQVWDPVTGEEYLAIPFRASGTQCPFLTFGPGGRHLLATGWLGDTLVWDGQGVSPAQRQVRMVNRTASWHTTEAGAAEAARDWFAAIWHLERLAKLDPAVPDVQHRLRKAKAALAVAKP